MQVDLTAAKHYGDALFDAARDAGESERILEEARALIDALDEVPRFADLLQAPHIDAMEKIEVAKRVLGDHFHPLLRNFVLLLLKRGRIVLFRHAIVEFRDRAEAAQGIRHGAVRTATELSDEEKQRIHQSLEAYTGQKLNIDWLLDPAVLGGVVFKSGDLLIDNSLRSRLKDLRERLMAVRVH